VSEPFWKLSGSGKSGRIDPDGMAGVCLADTVFGWLECDGERGRSWSLDFARQLSGMALREWSLVGTLASAWSSELDGARCSDFIGGSRIRRSALGGKGG